MTIEEASDLLRPAFNQTGSPTTWLDLGCGSGIFTMALAQLLETGSQIIAVDKTPHTLPAQSQNGVTITFQLTDMEHYLFPQAVNGILLANSLHYIKRQTLFMERMINSITRNGKLILVEYDIDTPNPWVPYPLSVSRLNALCKTVGINPQQVTPIGQRPSIFGPHMMYSCKITI